MKKIIIYSIILLAAVSFYSCNKLDDFLGWEPVSQGIQVSNTSADSALYKTASEVEAALAGAYGDFKNEYFQIDYYVNGDAQGDDAYAGADNPANFQIDDYNLDATNSNVSRDWAYLYATIGKTNAVYNNVDSVPDPNLTGQRAKEIKGEAAFIRAFMYFQAVQLWGDVPLQLQDVTTISIEVLPEIYPMLFPPRVPKEEVYAQIIKDLEEALTSVPSTQPHKGYATKGAVNTLLAKVYATREPHDWAKVQQYCDAVINAGYSLMPSYEDLWDNAQENCAESIFEINFTGGSSDGNWGTKMWRGMDWKKFNIPSNDLVKAFDENQDNIRKNASIIWEDVSGKWSDPHWPQTEYPFLNKWRKFTEGSDQNYIIYRLADILLLKAEALNEQGDVAGAAELVNQVRSRVSLANTAASTQAEMRLAIEKERRLELSFEGHRWYDLKRTGRAIDVMNNTTGVGGVPIGYSIGEEDLVWPIPQAELDKNVNLTQNPGY
jgi:hypothetical protein